MAFEPSREGQLTEQGLGFGYWWVTHKVQVRRATTIALAVIAAPLLAYGIYGFADWFFGSGVGERAAIGQLVQSPIDYAAFRAANAPKDIRVDSPLVLSSGTGTYDLTARVQNPNPQWWAEFDYSFGDAPTTRTFLLPGESRQLSSLGVKSDSRPSALSVSITNVAWHRVDLHQTQPDYATWAAARLGISIKDAAFSTPQPTDAVPVWRATFTASNDTAFGYYDVHFIVTLISGTSVVGVNDVTVGELRPGDQRPVTASWYEEPPTVTKIDVKPVLNIFDAQTYIPAGR